MDTQPDTNSTVVKRIQYRKWTHNLTLTVLWLMNSVSKMDIQPDTNSTVVKRIQYQKWTQNQTLTLL